MVALLDDGSARKHRAGKLLLVTGGGALLMQLWALWLETGTWSHAAADSLGWVGTLGLATLQVVHFIAWNPNGILLSVARLLLLCWPMAVMLAGVALSHKAN